MTTRREWLDRSEEEWVRAFVLDGMSEPAARRHVAEMFDAMDRTRAAGGKVFWDLATVRPMACADAEFGRRIRELFGPVLEAEETHGEDEPTLSADDRAAPAASREELARRLAKVRACVGRLAASPKPPANVALQPPRNSAT